MDSGYGINAFESVQPLLMELTPQERTASFTEMLLLDRFGTLAEMLLAQTGVKPLNDDPDAEGGEDEQYSITSFEFTVDGIRIVNRGIAYFLKTIRDNSPPNTAVVTHEVKGVESEAISTS